MITIAVTLTLHVYDEAVFRRAAWQRALDDGLDDESAARYLKDELIEHCAIMLFDPGTSPAGCEIIASEAGN